MSFKVSIKVSVSSLLIASMLATAPAMAVFAEVSTSNGTQSPEVTLLENVLVLRGSKLSVSDYQQRFASAISDYAKTASAEGQQERMKEALVDIGAYTPAQAEAFTEEARTAQDQVRAANPTSMDQASGLLNQEVAHLVDFRPEGAQFSMCTQRAVAIGIPVVLGGTVAYLAVTDAMMPAVIVGILFAISLSDFSPEGMSCDG